MSGAEDVDRAYAAAAAAFESWGDTTPQDRANALLKIAEAIEARVDEINAVECKDTGKPLGLTMSEEMPYASDHFRFFAGAARVLEGSSAGEYMADHTSWVRREPVGVVGQVTPWNYPLMMMIWKIAPALAGGNTIVLKPSDTTPAQLDAARPSCARSSCRPASSTSSAATATPAAAWSSTRRPQMVAITGSVRAGMEVAGSAAADLKRVHLELGGKAPVIVFDDADIEKAAEGIAMAGYFNAGQDCTAATRVLAGPGVHDDFVAALTEQAKNTRTGLPDDEDVLYGALNNENQLSRVTGMVDRLPDHATVNAGGHAAGQRRLLLRADRAVRSPAGRRADPDTRSSARSSPCRGSPTRPRRCAGPTAWSTAWPRASGPRTTAARCGCPSGSTSAWCGSTPTSRSSRRCRTAASSTRATARTCRCTASRTTRASSTS